MDVDATWAILSRNASDLEVEWTIACSIVLLLALWRIIRFTMLWRKLRKLNGQYVRERRASIVRVVRYVERSYLLFIFVTIGFIAMTIPPPIRDVNQQAAEWTGTFFLSGAVAMLIGSILEETLEYWI